jgi:dienelactone hydrolase
MTRLEVSPQAALSDEPVAIRVTGLLPGQPVSLLLEAKDDLGRVWRSTAEWLADGEGSVDAAAAPRAGSYQGADGMGLFWSLRPVEPGPPFILRGAPPYTLELSALVNGEVAARATCERRFVGEGVTRSEVRDDGLVATLFEPPGRGPHPLVIVLMGSGGGLNEQRAALLASRGFAALALAYFAMPGLPSALCEIPLEYFDRALDWAARRPSLDAGRVFLWGQSRGGELALLLGAERPARIHGVIGWVGSGVVFGGVGGDPSTYQKPSWTRDGRAVPYLSAPSPEIPPGKPYVFTPLFEQMIADVEAREEASIAVEKIGGPVLLISAVDDALWPSVTLSELAMRRMEARGHRFRRTHLRMEGAGHMISIPYGPTTTRVMMQPVARILIDFGGNPAANAAASTASWRATLDFLREHLE